MPYEGGTEHHHAPGGDNPEDHQLRAQAETDAICEALIARLREGTLPPDEAYWWTRIALSDVIARLADGCP